MTKLQGEQLDLFWPCIQLLTSMKIITLHQPWASLIALKLKRYETRHWATAYRGPLLIHAAKQPLTNEGLSLIHTLQTMGYPVPSPGPDAYPFGSIVAIAQLSACHEMTGLLNLHGICISAQSELERTVGWWEPGRFALQLDIVRSLQPIPWKSRQGKLLDAPSEIVKVVNQQLQEVV
jgi:hypothetical protein